MNRSFSKLAIVGGVTLSLLLPLATVSANETPLRDRMQTAKAQIRQIKETAKAEIKQIREELSEGKRTAMSHAMNGIKERFEHALVRMGDIAERMTTKAKELASKGVNITEVENLIAAAKAKLQTAGTLITAAEAQFQGLADAADRPAAFQAFRTSIQQIKEALKSAHTTLQEAAKKLKTIYQASQTPTPSPSA
ncbi:MAG: hypothetical protein HY817_03180 [Candidatus Abawacabacteria bacterium]|nr:hypothetical protein [Candidatus Abawacabacteria bacterium]